MRRMLLVVLAMLSLLLWTTTAQADTTTWQDQALNRARETMTDYAFTTLPPDREARLRLVVDRCAYVGPQRLRCPLRVVIYADRLGGQIADRCREWIYATPRTSNWRSGGCFWTWVPQHRPVADLYAIKAARLLAARNE